VRGGKGKKYSSGNKNSARLKKVTDQRKEEGGKQKKTKYFWGERRSLRIGYGPREKAKPGVEKHPFSEKAGEKL